MSSFRLIFLGSPDFALPSLQNLLQNKRFDLVAVFTQPDKKVGRKQLMTSSPVKRYIVETQNFASLQVHTPSNINTPENIQIIKDLQPDFLFTAAYGQIICQEILEIPTIEPINLHGSLLPKYRGASPIQTSLLNGDKKTGITFIRMVKKMDAGEIFYQEKIGIEPEDNAETLFDKIANLGGKLTPEVLIKIAEKKLLPLPQNDDEASYCVKITKENGRINWEKETAEEIYNKIRAYTPWPGCHTTFEGKMLKIIKAVSYKPQAISQNLNPGKIISHNSQILITTKSGYLEPLEVQLEGKKPMPIEEFVKGKPEFVGNKLG